MSDTNLKTGLRIVGLEAIELAALTGQDLWRCRPAALGEGTDLVTHAGEAARLVALGEARNVDFYTFDPAVRFADGDVELFRDGLVVTAGQRFAFVPDPRNPVAPDSPPGPWPGLYPEPPFGTKVEP